MFRRIRLPTILVTLGLFFILLARSRAAAPSASGVLANTLTHEEFVHAGLEKLTPEELAALETALIQHQQLSRTAKAGKGAAAPEKIVSSNQEAAAFGSEQVSPAKPAETEAEMHTQIEGTLDGFSGRAVFVLANGQVWQQRVPETVYFATKLANPEVILTRSFAGYKMLIVPADRVVFVKRIQ